MPWSCLDQNSAAYFQGIKSVYKKSHPGQCGNEVANQRLFQP